MLLHAYVRPRDRVLDFACGKGGDLTKYRKAEVGSYVGVDIALESERRDAVERYNGGDYPFPRVSSRAIAAHGDLTTVFEPRAFDVVSCQFAVHYSWSTEERARRTASATPRPSSFSRPGGHFIGTTVDANVLVRKLRAADGVAFGNAIVEVRFADAHRKKLFPTRDGPFGLRYAFTLQDAVTDCDEWLVPRKSSSWRFRGRAAFSSPSSFETSTSSRAAQRRGRGPKRRSPRPAGLKTSALSRREKNAEKGARGDGARHVAAEFRRAGARGRDAERGRVGGGEPAYATFAFRLAGRESAAKAVLNRRAARRAGKIHPRDVLVLEGAA